MPKAGLEPTSLVFQACLLPLDHIGSLMSPLYPHSPVCAAPYLSGRCRLLYSSHWNCKFFNAYNYIQAMALHTHTQGMLNNHTACSLYRIMVMATSVVGVTKMGNIVPKVGFKPTSLSFWASVLLLHHVGSLMSPLYPYPPGYVALCLRGQCRLLQYV